MDRRDRQRLSRLAEAARGQLVRNIAPFWLALRDDERGGFHGAARDSTRIDRAAPRTTVLTARIAWSFAALHEAVPDPAYADAARHAAAFLLDRHRDPADGAVVWSVSADGAPLDTRKHLYGQAFAVYGLATVGRVLGDPSALAAAEAIWRQVRRVTAGLAFPWAAESFTADWRPEPNTLMGRADGQVAMNTLLHLLEAAHALSRASDDGAAKAEACRLVEAVLAAYDPEARTFPHFFGPAPMDRGGSLGHDIEAWWLATRFAADLDPALSDRVDATLEGLPDSIAQRGLRRDGALATGLTLRGKPDRQLLWWVQAEALAGYATALSQTGDPAHLGRMEQLWRFVERRLAHVAGEEWLPRPRPVLARRPLWRADAWKCPYHNTRACLEIIATSQRLAAL